MMFNIKNVFKTYDNGMVKALSGLSMTVGENEIVAVMGPSGSGKSTLLSLMGTLDRPTAGQILYKDRELFSHLPLHRFRSRNIGFIFQFHHLLPSLTLLENVELPLIPFGISAAERRSRAGSLLEQMGLASRQSFLPPKTSGGERQRAAIARALVHKPEVILADEPTGNLDTETGEMVMNLFIAKCRERGSTAVIATHNPEVAAMADRQLFMRNGCVV
jgi:ABC-type lipoprotein export system ATPase subunit